MAEKEPKEPRVKKTLNDRQISERKGTLVTLNIEKLKLDRQAESKRKELKVITDQVNMIDQQIMTVTTEIDEKTAWIPRQLALGEDPDAEPPIAGATGKSGKKKRASKRSANGVAHDEAGESLPVDPG